MSFILAIKVPVTVSGSKGLVSDRDNDHWRLMPPNQISTASVTEVFLPTQSNTYPTPVALRTFNMLNLSKSTCRFPISRKSWIFTTERRKYSFLNSSFYPHPYKVGKGTAFTCLMELHNAFCGVKSFKPFRPFRIYDAGLCCTKKGIWGDVK